MKLEFISKNKDGNYYIGYRVPVKRGIRGKEDTVDELVIIGMPKDRMEAFCQKHGIEVINDNPGIKENSI